MLQVFRLLLTGSKISVKTCQNTAEVTYFTHCMDHFITMMLPVYNNDDTWFSGELGSEVNEELDVEGERGSSFMHTPVEANI